MRRTERAAYRTKFYSNLSSPTRFDEEPNLVAITGSVCLFKILVLKIAKRLYLIFRIRLNVIL